MRPRAAGTILAGIRDGKLREIGPKLAKLSAPQRRAASEEVCRLLEEVVSKRALAPTHRWLITALQFLAPPAADDLLTRTLAQAINLNGCCGCTLNRTMRALGAIGPPQAIPVLVDVIRDAEHPRHKHLAAVCVEKIVRSRGAEAEAILTRHAARLRPELNRLQEQVAVTKPATPARPWLRPPGSPGWLAAANRAVKGIERLLSQE